ncbi:hypothetical protein [Paenibacillus validus]|uniref:Translation initiation factor 2 n=1 Tax=Paenibacillus validus TaxID=44253 RepID=A0A7X2Z781_9BACL|nr:hypothetical protein [Paenibacillus validus]MUG69542.1 hypothetical protein [Paenibacillus validus]
MNGSGWFKFGAIALAMAFCLFFGVSLATQGTERIHGPLTKPPGEASAAGVRPNSAAPAGAKKSAPPAPEKSEPVKKTAEKKTKPAAKAPQEPAADTGINRVGNKAGELLQIIAYHGIRAIVSLFEAMLK